jgi:hypothetical protein
VFDDLDGVDVGAHLAERTGDAAQRSRPVGEDQTQQEHLMIISPAWWPRVTPGCPPCYRRSPKA